MVRNQQPEEINPVSLLDLNIPIAPIFRDIIASRMIGGMSMLLYYEILFGLSILFSLIFVFMWHKHFDVNITLVFFLVPLSTLSYVAMALSENLQEAILATQIMYINGVFTILFVLMTILDLCRIRDSSADFLSALRCCFIFLSSRSAETRCSIRVLSLRKKTVSPC